MKTAIKQLKAIVCENSAKGRDFRKQIQSLSWKDGTLSEVQKLKSLRDGANHRVNGKRSVKAFRRPETGNERSMLWGYKRNAAMTTRDSLLAYGMLRGRAYKTLELKCAPGNAPSAYGISEVLEGISLVKEISRELIEKWLDGEAVPSILEVAA